MAEGGPISSVREIVLFLKAFLLFHSSVKTQGGAFDLVLLVCPLSSVAAPRARGRDLLI